MVIEARGYGTVNIHGGSYYNTQKLNTQINLIYARENGKINIYGGPFESGKYGTPNNDTDGRYWVLNLKMCIRDRLFAALSKRNQDIQPWKSSTILSSWMPKHNFVPPTLR